MSEQKTSPEDNKPKDEKPNFNKIPKLPKGQFNFYWIYAIVGIILVGLQIFQWEGQAIETSTKTFLSDMLKHDDVERVVIIRNETLVEIYIKADRLSDQKYESLKKKKSPISSGTNKGPHFFLKIGSVDKFEDDLAKAQADKPETERLYPTYEDRQNWAGEIIGWLLPIFLITILWIFLMRRMGSGGGPGGQIFNIGKSKATLFDKDAKAKITFNDVAGLEGAKEEIEEIVDFLKNPKKYTDLGAKIPKGALLIGPPGTGKTLLAKAVAGEAQVPFFSLSGSDFVEMFVGVGASRVRDLFKQAKEKAPSIIFIDEIDAIGRARGKGPAFSANDERENTLNQLLTEMDGFGTNSGVIILAATNRADILDKALLRPGRFDRQIQVDMPNVAERKEIFKVHLKPLKLDKELDLDFLSKQTPGFSGADIANLCNEAALIAARKKKNLVEIQDFLDAVDRIVGGLEKKTKIITPQEKRAIAFHEAGHATVSWMVEHAAPLVKVTIIPRGHSLGAAWYLPEERQITTKEQIMDEICAALGGRVAEEIILGKVSTGALSDLEKITKQAYAMVTIYGLNDAVGNISFYDSSGQTEYSFQKPYSDKTAELIDIEVKKIVDEAYTRTKNILLQNKEKLILVAERLLDKEVIFKEDVEAILGKRQWDVTVVEPEAKKTEPASPSPILAEEQKV